MKVLVVDDEPLMLASLSRLLAGAGYQVHTARNGTEDADIADSIVACD